MFDAQFNVDAGRWEGERYTVGDYDGTCFRKAEFGMGEADGCKPFVDGSAKMAAAVAGIVDDGCHVDSACKGGGGVLCSRSNFGSAGGGCSPGSNSPRDFRQKQTYELVEVSTI